MKKTLILLLTLWVVAALLGVYTPWRAQHMIQMGIVLGITGVLFGLFLLVARAIHGRSRAESDTSFSADSQGTTGLWSVKILILFVIALLGETVWFMKCASLDSVIMAEGGYYLILLTLGYALSRWCNSKQYVPILMAILLLLAHSTWQTIQFLNNPSAQFQFGPEIVIFAASQIAGQLTMLPLDATVIWGAWSIEEGIKRISKPAQDVSTPDVDSSRGQS